MPTRPKRLRFRYHPLPCWLALLVGLFLMAGCDRYAPESDSRKEAVRYFYGDNAHQGYMLFTWDTPLRDEKIRQKRNSLGLDEDWEYWDEQVNVISLGDQDYFITYALSFKNRSTGEIFIKEEKYVTVDENEWQPIPLMHEFFKSNPVTGEFKRFKTEVFSPAASEKIGT